MFISPGKPQVDMVSLRDHVFTLAAADSAPWLFKLNHIDTALVLQQPQLRDMSFHPLSLRGGWPQQPAKRGHQPPSAYGTGYLPEAEQLGKGMSLAAQDDSQTSTGNRAPKSPVAYPPYTEQTAISHASSTNIPVVPGAPELPLGPQYWRLAPHGTPAGPPFAYGGDSVWSHAQHGGHCLVDYGEYALGHPAGALPHPIFQHAPDALRDLSLAPVPDGGDSGASPITLYSSSDMLGAAVLGDEPTQSPWDVSPEMTKAAVCEDARFHTGRCVQVVAEQDAINSRPWADPDPERADEATVSPKMLRIRQTPTPASSLSSLPSSSSSSSSSADSVQATFPADTHHTEPPGRGPIDPALRGVQPSAGEQQQRRQQQQQASPDLPRQRIPKAASPSRHLPALLLLLPKTAAAHAAAAQARRVHCIGGRARTHTAAAPSPLVTGPAEPAAAGQEGGARERITTTAAAAAAELADRMSKDEFLVRQKQMGRTYKEIRRLGGFTEAESTLRGRYRTLTKCREARVRKPEWSETDLRLLERGVRKLAHTPDLNPAKVPWKRVAEYIVAHGGSYHFGNSTCRKRWDELVREQAARGKSLHQPFFDDYDGGGAVPAAAVAAAAAVMNHGAVDRNGGSHHEHVRGAFLA
ncbi:hypothetical protein VTH06DRAFT_3200 [Thermothelomyces fergusii]